MIGHGHLTFFEAPSFLQTGPGQGVHNNQVQRSGRISLRTIEATISLPRV
jgi:hypothetical protein